MNLSEAIKQWMEVYKKSSVKQATYDRMLTSLCLMNKYPLANVEPERLAGIDIQQYINSLLADGYALTTIKKQFNLVSGYIRFANVEGTIVRPLYNAVKLPSQAQVHKTKHQVMAYTEQEQQRLNTVLATKSTTACNIVAFMLNTGLRVGEALALKQEDICWQRKAITVRRTLVRLANPKDAFVQNTAKSHASNRVIPLNEEAWRILNDMPKTREYVFGAYETRPFSYEALRGQVKALCKAAKVPYLELHVFRHTFATNCYNRGCDVKLLSRLLGHGSVSVTYNTYIHLYGDALDAMRAVV